MNDPTSQLSARQALELHSRLFDLIKELKEVESSLNPNLPTRDEASWSKFIAWLDQLELERTPINDSDKDTIKTPRLFDRVGIKQQVSTSKAVSEYDNTDEYSLTTKVPFAKGDKIFDIDRGWMLSTETALKDLDLGEFIKKDSIASGMQNVVLVLHLLNERSKGEQSQWWPYLSILPNRILPVLRMDRDQFSRHLIASSHLFEALKMLRAIVRQYAYFYKSLQATKLPVKRDFTFTYYTWGVSNVCSRQNEIPHHKRRGGSTNNEHRVGESCLPSTVHALIPILDMCNHDRNSSQATFEDNSSCLVASRDLQPNQEITINYGCRSSGDFYIHNGFVPDEVQTDVVPLVISLNQKQDRLFALKVKILKTLNMPTTFGQFKLSLKDYANRHRRDPHLTMFLIVYLLNQEEAEFILDHDNPVGVADEIYEYVQYKTSDFRQQQSSDAKDEEESTTNGTGSKDLEHEDDDRASIDEMKKRLAKRLKEYLSRRASISIALIDRSLEELGQTDKTRQDDFKLFTNKLLQHEKRIFSSYVE